MEIVPGRKDPTKNQDKLTIEHRAISNGDLIISTETQRKLMIKSVHDDLHCGVAATKKKKKIKLEAWNIDEMSKNI